MLKSKTTDRALQSSERENQSHREEYLKTIAGNYQEILKSLRSNEVAERLQNYEDRMKSFESEIQSIHMNMSQQNLMISQNFRNFGATDKNWSSSVAEPERKILDDSVNYKSKESVIMNDIERHKSRGFLKVGHKQANGNMHKVSHPQRNESASVTYTNSIGDFESSPILQQRITKKQVSGNSGTGKYTHLVPYQTSNTRVVPTSNSSTDQKNLLKEEEITILEMEIELLKKKLKYYRSQLENVGPDSSTDWDLMIQTIDRQLNDKLQELQSKTLPKSNLSQVSNYGTAPRLSGIERKKKRLDNQINQLNVLSNDLDDEMCLTHESRMSSSSMTSNVTIPNEYDQKPVRKPSQLSHVLMNYQMHGKPKIDFGTSPDKGVTILTDSMSNVDNIDNICSESDQQIFRAKNKYSNLKESMQFHPKNCFNRDK